MTQDIFVGREDEQKQYRDFLSGEETWMLLITGLGGIGKSSLLRRLAEQTPSDTCVVIPNLPQHIPPPPAPLKPPQTPPPLLPPPTTPPPPPPFLNPLPHDTTPPHPHPPPT